MNLEVPQKKQVFRVQDQKGCGPYRNTMVGLLLPSHSQDDFLKTHPSPMFDMEIRRCPRINEVCCFTTINQMKNWFKKEELEILLKNKFQVITAIAECTAISNLQSLCLANTLSLVTPITLNHVFHNKPLPFYFYD